MNEPKRNKQVAKVVSYASKPFGWFLHLEYQNDKGKISYAQVGFGPHPDASGGIFPLWENPQEPVVINCPYSEAELFLDYTGDLLVPIPEMVIQTMFTGSVYAPKTSGIRRT